ncbi:oxidoreductase-like domain-containing protein [Azoarcus olearius]|uniref:Oxidoreductase-like domain-containing protein n=1 Tax=Azoarcus sp. (strain BH72) TaxID=418699 RepID=A1K4C7_AZOSB|nr:oxidoreductase-like domain-containing protein [Azoarcus olearius]CAL93682.1 conserved hypothetical protein [Azoarcus olearius]
MLPSVKPSDPLTAPVRTLVDAEAAVAAIRGRLECAGLSLRPPPAPPTACCGRGCNGCVWEGYYSALGYWREDARRLLAGEG